MSISIVSRNAFSKYNVTTGAGTYNLPREDVTTLYGPGWPIAPIARPEDTELPREIDYPVAVNMTLQPRVGYEGLMPVKALKSAYTNVSEVSIPVNVIIRELSGFVPMLRDKGTLQRVKADHPFNWMTVSPDRVTPFNVWMSRYKKSAKIFAAPAFYLRRDGKGQVDALEYIDGSTLFLLINSRGKLPEPGEVDSDVEKYIKRIQYGLSHGDWRMPLDMPTLASQYLERARKRLDQGKALPTTTPAFTQIIKGIPFSFWDKSQVYFVPETPASAVDSPYGESYIERAWTWINIIAVLTAFELGHYRTGNMPEGFAILPKDWFPSMAKLAIAEREFNARMAEGSQTQHSRIRFGPEGMKWIPTKKPDFPRDLYKNARDNIFYALGVPTSEIGERSSRGLGGKGFEQGAAHDMTRQILESEKRSLEDAFNTVLLKNGEDKVEFYLDYPQEEIDPNMQQEALWNKFIHGVFTMNDVLTAQGKEVIGTIEDKDNIANMHMIVAGSSIYVIEKMVVDEAGAGLPVVGGALADVGGSPANTDEAVAEGKEHTPDDRKTAEAVAKALELTGGRSVDMTRTFLMAHSPVAEEIQAAVEAEALEKAAGKDHPKDKCWNCDKKPTRDVTYALGFGRIWFCTEHFEEFYRAKKNKKLIAVREVVGGKVPAKWKDGGKEIKKTIVDEGRTYRLRAPVLDVDVSVLGLELDVDFSATSREQFRMGLDEELEHGESVDWDGVTIAEIVLDHLREDPEYYTHLKAAMEKRYKVVGDGPFRVINSETGKTVPGGEHESEEKAKAHMRAMYANVPDAKKADETELNKHCGVCAEDAEYFGAPVSRQVAIPLPSDDAHANEVEIVALVVPGKPSIPALWKPEGGEALWIQEEIGGAQYVREEAAWVLAQSLGFPLIPLAYTAEAGGENGAAVWYTFGATEPRVAGEYAAEWQERAAVLDYIMCQRDRHDKHNYLTHPDDPSRMILVDNGFSFPANAELQPRSVFCEIMTGKPLSEATLMAIRACLGDIPMWKDIKDTIASGGGDNPDAAVKNARAYAQRILDGGTIPGYRE